MNLVTDFSIPGVLDELSRSRGTSTAIVCGDVEYNYRTLRDRSRRLADALAKSGVGPGDRVLWLGQNSHRVLECLAAVSYIGAMFCPANWRQSAEEIAFIIDDLAPKVVIWQEEEVGAPVREARGLAATQALWIQHDSAPESEYEAFLETGSDTMSGEASDPSAPVLVIYTAAFEGRPNGAMLSQNALMLQSLIVQRVQEISAATVFLNSGPMFHVGTLMTTFATFFIGGSNVFVRRTDPAELLRLIHDHRCTFAFLVSKLCAEMAELNKDGAYDLTCLLSPPILPEWDAMVTINPRDARNTAYGYGQTEVNGLISWTFDAQPGDTGPHGRVAPLTQLRVVNESGSDVPDGDVGEIVLRGPTVMNGYWNRTELNAERQRGGWHHTNDLGRREADGSVTFIGPKTQMIKSGVENIYPAEVEGCLRRHPSVADAAIIGVPDPKFVQVVKAIVQLKPGVSADPEELIKHCRAHMASYKKPRFVEFTDKLPRTQIGIIDYRALDAAYGGGNYPGGSLRGH